MQEEWMLIPEHPIYAISDRGRVLNTRTDRILKPEFSTGYARVNLRGKTYRVHRLVARAFCLGERPDLEVNHLDGDKRNNHAWNLEWTTRQANVQHAFRNGIAVSGRRTPIRIIETGEVFDSQMACAKAIGGWQPSVNAVLKGRLPHHKGYTFEYVK